MSLSPKPSQRANLILLFTAMIWGLAFVAQRSGMKDIGPFAYNGLRFALGSLSLLPVLIIDQRKRLSKKYSITRNEFLWAGLVCGVFLFAGSSFQQVGMVYTTAGNGGFITSLYVILVPVFGLFWRQKVNIQTWLGALMALVGMYFLSVKGSMDLALGDSLVFVSAFFFAGHVLVIGKYAPQTNIIRLSVVQFSVASVFSLLISLLIETTTLDDILRAGIPILYGGIMSVGVAYTLQMLGQKKAHPSHAAIILSLESLFAAIGGILILDEPLNFKVALGGCLMLAGVILSQLRLRKRRKSMPK